MSERRTKFATEPMPAARTRAESLRLKLEEEILTGRFAPGVKLDEEDLAARFGLSRTPVREALKGLMSSGLVEIRPHQGTFVATLTPRAITDMVETMAVLEAACAGFAARRHTPEDRRKIQDAQRDCETGTDPLAFYSANTRFHEAIYAASGNAWLAQQARGLRQRLEPYRRQITFQTGTVEHSTSDHRAIVRAIFDRDEEAAASAMRRHLVTLEATIAAMVDAVAKRVSKASPRA
jgi:DNA-binding GntR family transcriptional regulator